MKLVYKGRNMNRITAIAVIVIIVIASFMAGKKIYSESQPTRYRAEHIVQPGETLTHIAIRYYPNSNMQEKVYLLEKVNRLDNVDLHVGQHIMIPDEL